MAKRPKAARFEFPLSGTAIGVVVRAFQLPAHDTTDTLRGKTASRYFAGERVNDDSRGEILQAVTKALLASDVVAVPEALRGSLAPVVFALIVQTASVWDELAGAIRSIGFAITEPGRRAAAPMPFLRLLVIDLAVRSAAYLRLHDRPPPNAGLPAGARRDGRSAALRLELKRCTPAPTRDGLAEALGVHANTVDAWLDGTKRPGEESIGFIADELASRVDGSVASEVAARLRRHYAIRDILERLATVVGWDEVESLADRWVTYTRGAYVPMSPLALVPMDLAGVVVDGVRGRGTDGVLQHLINDEEITVWRGDLMGACAPWTPRLVSMTQQLSDRHVREMAKVLKPLIDAEELPISAEEYAEGASIPLAQQDASIPPHQSLFKRYPYAVVPPTTPVQKAMNRVTQAHDCLRLGDIDGALMHARRATHLDPQSADAHYVLSCALNLDHQFEDAHVEASVAHDLRPTWEAPVLEVATILNKTGRSPEACRYLAEKASLIDTALTPPLLFEWGVALMLSGDLRGAIAKYNGAIQLAPDHAMALDRCAHCHFGLGEIELGRRRATRARHLGESSAYVRWVAPSEL